MNRFITRVGRTALLLSLAACATAPSGPSVLVLPGSGRNFDQFRVDEATLR